MVNNLSFKNNKIDSLMNVTCKEPNLTKKMINIIRTRRKKGLELIAGDEISDKN
jgi:hypothetical protein